MDLANIVSGSGCGAADSNAEQNPSATVGMLAAVERLSGETGPKCDIFSSSKLQPALSTNLKRLVDARPFCPNLARIVWLHADVIWVTDLCPRIVQNCNSVGPKSRMELKDDEES